MGLDDLRADIERKAREEFRKAEDQAHKEAQALVENAKEKRKTLLANAEEEAAAAIKKERLERLSTARLEAKMILSEAREEVLKAVVDAVWKKLKARRGKREYRDILARLIKQGAEEIGGKTLVFVDSEDRALAKSVLPAGASLAPKSISTIGGAVVTSQDGRVRVNNTFEALLEEKGELVRRAAFEKIFRVKK